MYTDELAEEMCELIADGRSLREITVVDGMPDLRTIRRWLRDNESFRLQYVRAKEEQAETYEEMMLSTARNEEDVNRARLIVDTMKWTAAKLKPKKYGDKIDMTTNGKDLPTPLFNGMSAKADESSQE